MHKIVEYMLLQCIKKLNSYHQQITFFIYIPYLTSVRKAGWCLQSEICFFPCLFEGHLKGKAQSILSLQPFLPSFGRGTGREDQMFLTLRRVHTFYYFVVGILYGTDGSRLFLGLFPSSLANRFFRQKMLRGIEKVK